MPFESFYNAILRVISFCKDHHLRGGHLRGFGQESTFVLSINTTNINCKIILFLTINHFDSFKDYYIISNTKQDGMAQESQFIITTYKCF